MGEIEAIRCDHDGLKMAEVQDGHLVLRRKHHGRTHVKIVPLSAFVVTAVFPEADQVSVDEQPHTGPS